VKVPGGKNPATLIGSLPGIHPGEVLELLGEWGKQRNQEVSSMAGNSIGTM
jgi:hypothetical protein